MDSKIIPLTIRKLHECERNGNIIDGDIQIGNVRNFKGNLLIVWRCRSWGGWL